VTENTAISNVIALNDVGRMNSSKGAFRHRRSVVGRELPKATIEPAAQSDPDVEWVKAPNAYEAARPYYPQAKSGKLLIALTFRPKN
jgi:hypothetical protein